MIRQSTHRIPLTQLLLLLVLTVLPTLWATTVSAQPILTPRTMGLGGSGTAYLTSYSANFFNPANLMIREQPADRSFGMSSAAVLHEPVFDNKDLGDRTQSFIDTFRPYKFNQPVLGHEDRTSILDNYYDDQRLHRTFTSRYDAILFGVKWRSGKRAYSIALRSRGANSYTVGRGWYNNTPVVVDDQPVVERMLTHRIQTFQELSIGYAESFTFVNGLNPHLSHLYIGIAPKFIVGGMHLDANYDSRYIQSADGKRLMNTQSLSYYAAGDMGLTTINQFEGDDLQATSSRYLRNSSIFNPTGYGVGLDFGLTYLFTMGSDLSDNGPSFRSSNKTIRLSFSITDIGYINYDKHPIQLQSPIDSLTVSHTPAIATEAFMGAPGQFIPFLEQQLSPSPVLSTPQENQKQSYSKLLPTAAHGGLLIQYKRLKLMADLNYGLTDNAFNSRKITAHAGLEFYPLKFLPIRLGTRLKHKHTPLFGVGTGIETRYWDLTVSALFAPIGRASLKQPYGAGAAALQFHF